MVDSGSLSAAMSLLEPGLFVVVGEGWVKSWLDKPFSVDIGQSKAPFLFSNSFPFDECTRESCPVTLLDDQVLVLMLPKRWTKTRGRASDTQQTLSESP